MFISLFVLAGRTLKFLFRLKLNSQLLRGGKSPCNLWSELQVMELKSLVVIDCLRPEGNRSFRQRVSSPTTCSPTYEVGSPTSNVSSPGQRGETYSRQHQACVR